MPKKFTEEEKKMIHMQLKEVASSLFYEKGYKDTSIEEISYNVGIGKGSFYTFFANKASLFFNIINDLEHQLHRESIQLLALDHQTPPENFRNYFLHQVNFMKHNKFFLELSDSTFIHNLWPQLPAEDQQMSIDFDIEKMTSISEVIKTQKYQFSHDIHTSSDILRNLAILYIHLELFHDSQITAEFYLDAVISKLIVPMEQ
ncbi:MAG: TetR/AcrR family transcriptional regulator [Clostridia bacterium]|nr:TetR/AcrR family transcriptional regulator [Clostridia bacterium]